MEQSPYPNAPPNTLHRNYPDVNRNAHMSGSTVPPSEAMQNVHSVNHGYSQYAQPSARSVPYPNNGYAETNHHMHSNVQSKGMKNALPPNMYDHQPVNPPTMSHQPYPTHNGLPDTNGYESYAFQYGQQYPPATSTFNNRYPVPQQRVDAHQMDSMSKQFGGMSVTKQGFNAIRGIETCDLLRMNSVVPKEKIEAPSIQLPGESMSESNCHPDLFRCTLTKVPETKSLLDKSRLPLGILLHPFRDLTHLSVIQCSTIVRCRSCRTYINPFVFFTDSRHWKCNLCFRTNDLPEDFRYNPITKMHDDPLRRPEIKNATIEFIASSEYMVRPPQPAIYLFILDVSRIATQIGYLSTVCQVLLQNLAKLPGDARTSVGFIAVDSAIRFYELGENLSQPRELVVTDVDDVFIPHPENLLVNLHEQIELIRNLLELLPEKFKESYDTNCALGAALQAAHKLMAPTGGRVTAFISCLPNYGPGALKPREDPSQRGNTKSTNLNPATDFYKKLALDCSGVHVAVDLFVVNAQFVDLATISGVSQVSAGCMYHFPLYSSKNVHDVEKLTKTLERYLTRKIGFEAVMRMRCTKGLSIHSFHGNFFVRTTDLLALPNINPDAGFGMQVSIDENLSDLQTVCFQAALLYTSSKGERRIRVHTLCLPITNNLHDVLVSADQQCIAGLLAKMAVDRSLQTSIADAREAFVNAVCDVFSSYKMVSSGGSGSLLAPHNLILFPLYILGLMKSIAFRLSSNLRTDDRVYAMYLMKCIPLDKLIQIVYPDLYPLHNLVDQPRFEEEGKIIPKPPILHLSAEHVDSTGVYLLDEGDTILVFICHNIPPHLCHALFGYPQFSAVPDYLDAFPTIETQENMLANAFIGHLQSRKSSPVILSVLKDTPQVKQKFYERLVDDKCEIGVSYYEFLQTISSQMNS